MAELAPGVAETDFERVGLRAVDFVGGSERLCVEFGSDDCSERGCELV